MDSCSARSIANETGEGIAPVSSSVTKVPATLGWRGELLPPSSPLVSEVSSCVAVVGKS
eukprot:COSAG05_NODE_2714_length_2737_cov_140.062412_3_plen_59_part_00